MPRPATLRRAHSMGAEQGSPIGATVLSPLSESNPLSPDETLSDLQGSLARQNSAIETTTLPQEGSLPTIRTDENKKLLLVDDNNINLKVLSAIIAKLGQGFEVATNGVEAVEAYQRCPRQFSGILMDISMPVMDGLEATRRIRTYEHKNELPVVPVLALTGLSSETTHREALESGVDVFLTKPVKFKTLREALGSVGLLVP